MKKAKKLIGLFIYKFSFIKKNRIMFKSFNGKFNDNPRFIYYSMRNLNPNLEYIWVVNNINSYNNELKCKVVEIDSLKYYYYFGSSGVVVDNVHGINSTNLVRNDIFSKICFIFFSWLRKKKNQTVYSTWHGTPLKKLNRDKNGRIIIDNTFGNGKFLLGDSFVYNILNKNHFNKVPCKIVGIPRDDILHSSRKEIEKIKGKLKLPLDKKIVLFAPTFRTNCSDFHKDIMRSGFDQINSIDFNKLFAVLNKKYGGNWIFICRFHYHVEKLIDWNSLHKKYGNKIINGNYGEDMSEYLSCTDILITDASSCMFDFCITRRPVFILFPDYDYYLNVERGLYYDIKKLPFPFSKDFNELYNNIKDFKKNDYEKSVEKLINEFGFIIDNNASEKVAKYILEDSGLL